MKIKIQMTKRLMGVICIIVAAVSFMGGMIYRYDDFVPIVEHDIELDKYHMNFTMPLDAETALIWLDWAGDFHGNWIVHGKAKGFEEGMPLEFHQASIDKYHLIKTIVVEFDEKWGTNE